LDAPSPSYKSAKKSDASLLELPPFPCFLFLDPEFDPKHRIRIREESGITQHTKDRDTIIKIVMTVMDKNITFRRAWLHIKSSSHYRHYHHCQVQLTHHHGLLVVDHSRVLPSPTAAKETGYRIIYICRQRKVGEREKAHLQYFIM
jgi:hypothetical protein